MARKPNVAMLVFAAAVLSPALAIGQTSSVSVADAARAARAQKKTEKPASKVFTDDDIASLKGTISVIGSAPSAQTPAAASATAEKPATEAAAAGASASATAADAAAPAVKDEGYWRKTFADARKKLAADSKELDILQREYNLKQQQFYTDPTVAMKEQNSNDDLKKTRDQIDMKKQDVANDNQAISDLEDELRKSGGDMGWARE